jgi:hypothetical protein
MSDFINKTDTPDVVDRWPYRFQHIADGDPLWDYLGAFASELHQIDVFIDELYEQRFLETATGRELEKLAAEVGVTRQDGETDTDLRFRARLRKAIAASDGTADDIETIMSIAFEDKDLSNIDVVHSTGAPVTQFRVPQPYLDDIPLTRADFESELVRAFPAGYGVEVATSDTWLLGESGSQGLGQGKLI